MFRNKELHQTCQKPCKQEEHSKVLKGSKKQKLSTQNSISWEMIFQKQKENKILRQKLKEFVSGKLPLQEMFFQSEKKLYRSENKI